MANAVTFCRNQGLLIFLFLFWFGVNGFLFSWVYTTLRFDDRFHYMYLMLGEMIFLARGTGVLLNFNCALLLLPMNRYINSWIRCHLLKNAKGTIRRLFDHSKGVHITIALAVCILSVVHTVLHLYNYFNFRDHFSPIVPDINLQPTKNRITLLRFLATVPGYTGFVMLFILVLLSITSFKKIRSLHHNLFGFLHYLSLVFLACMVFHGFGKLTKYQTNLKDHPLQCHSLNERIGLPECKTEPKFDYVKAASWKWLAFSLILHGFDRLLRLWRRWKECELVDMKINDDVIELVLSKKRFKAKPGQYVWVQCAELSEFEWHAFTLTKCPSDLCDNDQTFSVHIKVVGDWTMRLANLVRSTKDSVHSKQNGNNCVINIDEQTTDGEINTKPIFRVDGPYGSPHQDAFRFPVNISIAAGIGITPFLATIRELKNYQHRTNKNTFKMKKMHLIWVCRSIKEFSWVLKEMHDIENELKISNTDILDVQLHVTRETKQEVMKYFPESGINSEWLSSKINFGRPNFQKELEDKTNSYERERIGVFYCGSQQLGQIVYKEIKHLKRHGNVLIYNKESFG